MADPGPAGQDPFEGLPLFRDLAGMFTRAGPVNWELARQVGVWIATEGRSEPNIDPIDRIRLEELARVAELHVGQATGLDVAVSGKALAVRPVTRAEWAGTALDAYRPLLERLAIALGPRADDDEDDGSDAATELLGNLTQLMSPLLIGMQAGFMTGHLARRVMGDFDLPIPRPAGSELRVVAATIEAFASDWSLPLDDVRLWVCLDQITHHAVIARPHVRERLDELLNAYAGGFEPDANALEAKLSELDPTDPAALQAALSDPEAVLGAIQTPAQRDLLRQLSALVAAIEGFVDHVMDTSGRSLITSYGPLTEALRRRRVETGEGDRFVERLLGLELTQAEYDRGAAFVQGVLERAGPGGLSRLWASARELPTPAEVDAPGLWLARIDLDA